MYDYTYIIMYACINIYTYLRMFACMHVILYEFMYVRIKISTYVYISDVCVYVYDYVSTCVFKYGSM